MKGDYSRDTFDSRKHYRRVLMQQGRVQLDADWNEQVATLLHYVQSLARDVIGPYGAASDGQAFMIQVGPEDVEKQKISNFYIGAGRYYVDGILCEIDRESSYYTQPHYPLEPENREADRLPEPPFLVYLDVWERHITAVEDPEIHEVALGEADTATRSQVVWQVKVRSWTSLNLPFDPLQVNCEDEIMVAQIMRVLKWGSLQPRRWGTLGVRAKQPEDADATDACIVSPEARYRGAENQLYRVEIHRGGKAGDTYPATFKWSRENGSVVFPIRSTSGNTFTVEHLGRDNRFGLEVGDWVELIDDSTVLRGEASQLRKVMAIDPIELLVTLNDPAPGGVNLVATRHPLLRRWDQQGDGATDWGTAVVEGTSHWFELEDGIQIQFPDADANYASGSYWLITARTATGDVELRYRGNQPDDDEIEQPGLHHYVPLAIAFPWRTGTAGVRPPYFPITDLRHFIRPAASCPDFAVESSIQVKVDEPIRFGARVSNMYASIKSGLTYDWIIEGGTPATQRGEFISVMPDAGAEIVVAYLTVTGNNLPLNAPRTAKGFCRVLPRNGT